MITLSLVENSVGRYHRGRPVLSHQLEWSSVVGTQQVIFLTF